MDAALIASAALLGLVGMPHCAAMCGAPCGAIAQRCSGAGGSAPAALAGFLSGRLVGYALGGAIAAAGVALFNTLGGLAPALKPLWTLAHAAAFGFGLWLLVSGRLPAWFGNVARVPRPVAAVGGWQHINGPLRAGAAGTLWLALPCGLLQSALLIAALANTPTGGAAAMAAFAITSAPGLGLFPALWSRWFGGSARATATAARLAGLVLAASSGWALSHGLWERVAAYCGIG